jgi:hypothetical protein
MRSSHPSEPGEAAVSIVQRAIDDARKSFADVLHHRHRRSTRHR